MTQLKLLMSGESKLAYVWVPKCASSTMFQVFQILSGVPDVEMKRRVEVTDDMLSGYGSRRVQIRHRKVDAFVADHLQYSWFTIVREPYGRLISNYNNKIDFFAEKLAPSVFQKFEGQIREARAAHVDIPKIRRKLQKEIGFVEFVETIHANGTKFDTHFIPQTEHMKINQVPYKAVLKIETLRSDLQKFLEVEGIAAETIARTLSVAPRNQTKRSKILSEKLSDDLREKIRDIYANDFELLGYDR